MGLGRWGMAVGWPVWWAESVKSASPMGVGWRPPTRGRHTIGLFRWKGCCLPAGQRGTRAVVWGSAGDYGVEVADGQVGVGADRLELKLALLV